jgi:hypothetical protein
MIAVTIVLNIALPSASEAFHVGPIRVNLGHRSAMLAPDGEIIYSR